MSLALVSQRINTNTPNLEYKIEQIKHQTNQIKT